MKIRALLAVLALALCAACSSPTLSVEPTGSVRTADQTSVPDVDKTATGTMGSGN